MAQSISRRGQQRVARFAESIEEIGKYLSQISLDGFEDLVRRDAVGVDSYATSGTGSSIVATSRGSGSELTPVERAAEAALFSKKRRDPLREELRNIERAVFQAEDVLRRLLENMTFLMDGVERRRGRTASSSPCEICTVLPQTKRGMCTGCYDDWISAGAPEFSRWKAYMLATRSSDGRVLVTEQPAPRPAVAR